MINEIKKLSAEYKDEFIKIRRHLHANPELSFQEFKTCKFIKETLESFGLKTKQIADTGVITTIEGKNPNSRIIALRADIDALPIEEEVESEFRSKNPGVMHACGHDVHTTCLLGAAKILAKLQEHLEGTVRFIFQPAEEKIPGGANLMINDGALENPSPTKIYGLHVDPALEVGKFSFRDGISMASSDELYIKIKAKGGHAAAPHTTADPILIASHLIISLQQIISRINVPSNPSVLTIGAINGGDAPNVIPSEVLLKGTFRAVNENWRFKAHELIKEQTINLVKSLGASAEVEIKIGYPCLSNDSEITKIATNLAKQFVGSENVEETALRMGAEDFSYYLQKIPGCFFRLGTGNISKGITSNLHTPKFDVDENAIELGTVIMSLLAFKG